MANVKLVAQLKKEAYELGKETGVGAAKAIILDEVTLPSQTKDIDFAIKLKSMKLPQKSKSEILGELFKGYDAAGEMLTKALKKAVREMASEPALSKHK